MNYHKTEVREFRSVKQFSGMELAHLIQDESLEDYVLRGVEKVYNQPNGLNYMNPYTYVITFERAK